ncbi:MAG: hypothetical protein GX055_09975 [Desulfovibrionales bacterium]|nr:hypothetical protein [Desulfovibrionales bacterium]
MSLDVIKAAPCSRETLIKSAETDGKDGLTGGAGCSGKGASLAAQPAISISQSRLTPRPDHCRFSPENGRVPMFHAPRFLHTTPHLCST